MSEEKKELFPEEELVRSESFQVLRGENVREVLSCIDSYLASLARKMKAPPLEIKETLVPISSFVGRSIPTIIFLSPLEGMIENMTVFIEETNSKNIDVQLTIQEGAIAKTVRFNAKKGLLLSEEKLEIKKGAVVNAVYFVPEGETCSIPVIAFTFRGKR